MKRRPWRVWRINKRSCRRPRKTLPLTRVQPETQSRGWKRHFISARLGWANLISDRAVGLEVQGVDLEASSHKVRSLEEAVSQVIQRSAPPISPPASNPSSSNSQVREGNPLLSKNSRGKNVSHENGHRGIFRIRHNLILDKADSQNQFFFGTSEI